MNSVTLVQAPISVDAVMRSVISERAGGIDVFVGTTRDHADGRSVRALSYEAYEPMAIAEMQRIVDEAERRWPLEAVAVVHRLGHVPVGEASVVIAVSSAHRSEAFEACRFIIDTLKETVPIWKKEEFVDGTSAWSQHTGH